MVHNVGPPPRSFLSFAILAEGPVAVHHSQFEMTIGGQLFFEDVVSGGEHLADLHKGFVPGLGNDEDGVEGHSQADRTEE